MNVLVTGGTGFVGINIVRRLAAAGHAVLCMSRRAGQHDPVCDRFLAPVRDRVALISGDVGNAASLEAVWTAHRPTHIVHAAAITPTREMEVSMARTIINANLMGTVNVLEAARKERVHRVVFISSSAVYGETDEDVAISETAPLKIWGLYSIAKEASEKLCAYYTELHAFDTVVLRVGWAYGPMERPMVDSRYNMSLAYHAVNLALDGEEIRLVHLDHLRDWIYIEDLAEAVGTILEAPLQPHAVYNLSGGRGYTHRDLLETLKRVIPIRYRQVTEAAANVPPLLTRKRRGPTSMTRLQADTSYRPQFSLEEGLRRYVEWARREREQDQRPA